MANGRTKIVVTGGAGYIGSVLIPKLLQNNYEVIVIDNLFYGQTSLLGCINHPNFTFIRGDILDENDLISKSHDIFYKSSDIIIPLAGLVGAPVCKKNPAMSWKLNFYAVSLLSQYRDQLIIYPTTNSGYGTKSRTIHCTEETPLEPISEYGIHKVEAETFLLTHHPKTVAFRLATVFGVSPRLRWDLLVNNFVYNAMRDNMIIVFEPHAKRNYIHIKDVVNCILYTIENHGRMVGQVYNLGLDQANLSKLELAEIIKQFTKCTIVTAPGTIDPDKRNYIVSNKKLKQVGFEAMYSIEDGVEDLMVAYTMMPSEKHWWRNAP